VRRKRKIIDQLIRRESKHLQLLTSMAPAKKSKGSAAAKKEQAPVATSAAAKKAARIAKLEANATKARKAVEAAQAASDAAVADLKYLKTEDFVDALSSVDFSSLESRCSSIIILPSGGPIFNYTIVDVIDEYKRFIYLKAVTDDMDANKLSPSPLIDQVWHLHLLDTQSYMAMNQTLFPQEGNEEQKMIHHDPLGGDDVYARAIRIESTLKECVDYFGKLDGARKLIWNVSVLGDYAQPFRLDILYSKWRVLGDADEEEGKEKVDDSPITICLRDQTGEATFFQIKRSTKLGILFAFYAMRKGRDVESLRFLDEGLERLKEHCTPGMLELEDDCRINVMLEQGGC
jgi:hypothetical protein